MFFEGQKILIFAPQNDKLAPNKMLPNLLLKMFRHFLLKKPSPKIYCSSDSEAVRRCD
jgi:hypothetical protein